MSDVRDGLIVREQAFRNREEALEAAELAQPRETGEV
jgi:hypothetical protein